MLYKISSLGYFGGVAKVSRGPWYREFMVEDDGLDWFYQFKNTDGKACYLLSNNMAIEDRERVAHLYHTMLRNNKLSWMAGLLFSFEMVTRNAYLKKQALGWRFASLLGLGFLTKQFLMTLTGTMYSPLMGAYFRKYQAHVKTDIFEIKDAKKEYFYIDTSEYMNYSNATLSDEYHCHHGPQPVSQLFKPQLIF